VTFDAERNVIGHRRHRGHGSVGQRVPGKERHDAHDTAIQDQGVA